MVLDQSLESILLGDADTARNAMQVQRRPGRRQDVHRPRRLWGHANKGVKLTVTLGDVTRTAVANEHQQWSVEFPAFEASTKPISLLVSTSHGHSRTVNNILVGDVWYLTGSTMLTGEMALAR